MHKLQITVLGCSSSPGVPRITGEWGACDPENPKNRRTRCSILVEKIGPEGKTTVVIDTGPDFYQQMLAANVTHLDGVVYTHSHADHIHGIDDLRQFVIVQKHRMEVYGDKDTLDHLKHCFGYCFKAPEGSMYPPICKDTEIKPGKPFEITGKGGTISFLPIYQIHGPTHSLGFRIDNFAYSPDISQLPDKSAELLKDLDVWIVDALQYREHVSHFSLSQALGWIEKLAPNKAYLTHMHIPLDYETVLNETPDHVEPAYDGLLINL